jgi:hypothetical protein
LNNYRQTYQERCCGKIAHIINNEEKLPPELGGSFSSLLMKTHLKVRTSIRTLGIDRQRYVHHANMI